MRAGIRPDHYPRLGGGSRKPSGRASWLYGIRKRFNPEVLNQMFRPPEGAKKRPDRRAGPVCTGESAGQSVGVVFRTQSRSCSGERFAALDGPRRGGPDKGEDRTSQEVANGDKQKRSREAASPVVEPADCIRSDKAVDMADGVDHSKTGSGPVSLRTIVGMDQKIG